MSRKYLIVYAVLASVIGFASYVAIAFSHVQPFAPPDEKTRVAAIGTLDSVPPDMRLFLNPDDFLPIPTPLEGDWLNAHLEHGQTFDQYIASNPKKLGDDGRSTIYILPVGEFTGNAPDLEKLAEYLNAYFGCPVKVMKRDDFTGDTITTRQNPHTKNKQLLTRDIENALKKRLPQDAFALCAATMTDLYPDPNWNFVFGEASLRDRVGVFSFARYDPAFPETNDSKVTEETRRLVTLRSYKVMAHEVAHMFGIDHCIYFYCNMNGSNNLDEMNRQPLFMCPVELRKIQSATSFDPVKRYEKLKAIFERDGLTDEASWVAKRLSKLTGKNDSNDIN